MSQMPAATDNGEEEAKVTVESDNPTQLKQADWSSLLAAMKESDMLFRIKNLPVAIKRRLSALKKIQYEMTNVEANFFKEVHELECKYNDCYMPYFAKRESIINGSYEPIDEECNFPLMDESEDDLVKVTQNKLKIDDTQGIPEFWLTVLKNIGMTNEMIQPHDEPILKHLEDIKVILKPSESMGFKLIFNFSTNEYFSNTILTKEYEMKCNRDESDPFGFEGPEIYKCKGCKIDWYKGKNVTVATIKKKQKHKDHGSIRTVMKIVPADSFFNFFNPPTLPDDGDAEVEEDIQADLTTDFEIGHYLRERVIPRAVLYYTGEALDDEEDEDFDDEDESGDEGKMESDEEEEDMEEDEEEEEGDVECKGDN